MEFDQIFRFALALVFVLGLIGLISVLAKRIGFTPRVTRPIRGTKQRRLSIVEVMPVDAKRRLVLLRRDDREHLILLGADRDLVVETGVTAEIQAPIEEQIGAPARGLMGFARNRSPLLRKSAK